MTALTILIGAGLAIIACQLAAATIRGFTVGYHRDETHHAPFLAAYRAGRWLRERRDDAQRHRLARHRSKETR